MRDFFVLTITVICLYLLGTNSKTPKNSIKTFNHTVNSAPFKFRANNTPKSPKWIPYVHHLFSTYDKFCPNTLLPDTVTCFKTRILRVSCCLIDNTVPIELLWRSFERNCWGKIKKNKIIPKVHAWINKMREIFLIIQFMQAKYISQLVSSIASAHQLIRGDVKAAS